MKNLRKRILWIVLGIAAIALLVFSFLPKPVPVETAHAVRGTLQVSVEAEGQTRIHDLFTVASPVTGRLERVTLIEGDSVHAGQALAAIQPAPLDPLQRRDLEGRISVAETNVRQADAAEQSAAASLEQARRESDRMAQLEAAGSVSRQDRERAGQAVTSMSTALDAARSRTQAARLDLATARAGRAAYLQNSARASTRVVLHAPVGGSVMRVNERSERVVPAGTPILEIGDPAGMEIVVDVLSTDAVRIQPGAEMLVTGWGGDSVLHARVKYVEPSAFTKVSALGIEEQRVNVIAGFDALPAGLGNAFRVEAQIVVWEGRNVLKVPMSALFRDGERWSVYEVSDGKAHLVPVTLGRRNTFEAEVLRGITEKSIVVVHPSDALTDGSSVVVAQNADVSSR
ncbi:MAG TPA: HlyD family efflux transporter periplasmic adaptor subunit [Candidatus Kapabacteria bacterium]|nr:HlyD family efflux transporter periplasmic adaptor subunit [Candidatus Kapabacteria bacterium]